MEEAKAAAYYDELTRKGEGAARFKQGLGFSSQSSDANTTTNPPLKGSALPSSSSFLSSFVRAASPGRASELKKETELENIQKKLQKKQNSEKQSNVSDSRRRDGSKYDLGHDSKRSRRRSSSRERDRSSRRRSRSRSRDGHGSRRRYRSSSRDRERRIERERRRSRSPSSSAGEGSRRRGSGERKNRGRSRSSSPRDRRLEKGRSDGYKDRGKSKNDKEKNTGLDYSRLIEGFTDMTPAEKIKAKMKLQLSKTVEKDTVKGMGAGWERFEFNKDAPLDDEEEIEVAEDDAAVVKHMGQSFRFSAVEARREEEIKAAHDEAMFGASAPVAPPPEEPKDDTSKKESNENGVHNNLISEKVLAKQQGSWRDRARKLQDGSKS